MTGTQQDHHPNQRVQNQENETENTPKKNIPTYYTTESHHQKFQTEVDVIVRQQALAFNYIYDGVILTDLDGQIIDWNHGAERLFGYSKAEVMGKTPEILHKPEDAPVLTQAIVDGMIEQGHWQGEITFIRKDKTMGTCETIVVPFLDEEGNRVATVGINHDITIRKEAEEAMAKTNRSLENKIRERTHNLEDMNTALRVLLKKRDQDQTETEEKVLANIKALITPYVSRLKKSTLNASQSALIHILESNLSEIVSPFSRRLSTNNVNFTPSEIRVANLIKQGKTNKEIAGLLYLSIRTIAFHRENIRTKLGLKKMKINLRSYLSTMD